jgi:hypothetical protein
VLRTAPSRNWKDDINEPGRLEKDIDLIKRFVPRFGPFSDYQYQISTPMHIIAECFGFRTKAVLLPCETRELDLAE